MQNGVYFITICVKDRHPMFGEVREGRMVLSEYGEHARRCIDNIETIYPSVLLEESVVMPNHVHLLLVFMDYDANPSTDRVIKQYKSAVTKKISFSLWQEGAFTNAVLTAEKFRAARRYIQENPGRWKYDQFASTEDE